jgi:PTS system mannose-specific IIA component
MIGVLVATHGPVAEALIQSARGIVGRQEAVEAVGLATSDAPAVMEANVKAALDRLTSSVGVLILVDALGGTPCNVCLRLCGTPRRPLEVVTGVSLPMLVGALTHRAYMPLEQLAQKLVDDAARYVCRPLVKLRRAGEAG